MTRTLLLLASIIFASVCYAQTANSWDQLIQGVDIFDLDLDSEDNIYIVGKTREETFFSVSDTIVQGYGLPSTFNCCTQFLAKLSPLGELIWFQDLEYQVAWEGIVTQNDAPIVSVLVDNDDNVLVGGNMTERFNLGGLDLSYSSFGSSWFVAKYSAEGEFEWAEWDDYDNPFVLSQLTDMQLDNDGSILLGIYVLQNQDPETESADFFGEQITESVIARVDTGGSLIELLPNEFVSDFNYPLDGIWMPYDSQNDIIYNITTDDNFDQTDPSYVQQLLPDGTRQSYTTPGYVFHAECDGEGNLYLLKRANTPDVGRSISKYNSNMELQWSYSDPFGHRIRSFGVREDGMVCLQYKTLSILPENRIRLLSAQGEPLNTMVYLNEGTGQLVGIGAYNEFAFSSEYVMTYGRFAGAEQYSADLAYTEAVGDGFSTNGVISKIHINDIDEVIGVTENAKTSKLRLNHLSINTYQVVSEKDIESIAVFDISGKELSTQVAHPNHMLHFEALPQGLYLVHILTKTKQKMTFKIVR